MLFNRIQSTSMLFSQNQFSFATKNLKQIKLRMKAVESIRKITKAMKMVAASKMKQDVGRLQRAKNYGVGSVQKVIDSQTFLQKKKQSITPKKWLLVPITTDKGLCGGVNSTVVRQVKAMAKLDRNAYKVFSVGDKGSVALSRYFPDILQFAITHLQTPLNFPTASSVAYRVLEHSKDCDRIIVLYNEFKNVISQVLKKGQVLTKDQFLKSFKYVVKHDAEQPDLSHASHFFYEFYLNSFFYHAMLNNIASEQSSRMNAMENASKNAGQIVQKLTLEYNKARQAKITMQLCEIISGAAAV